MRPLSHSFVRPSETWKCFNSGNVEEAGNRIEFTLSKLILYCFQGSFWLVYGPRKEFEVEVEVVNGQKAKFLFYALSSLSAKKRACFTL